MTAESETGSTSQTRIMGCSRAEFHHSVKALLNEREWQRSGECYRISLDGGWAEIEAGNESVRRIASLSLPSTQVHLRFFDVDDATTAAFLRRFEIAFQRGGG